MKADEISVFGKMVESIVQALEKFNSIGMQIFWFNLNFLGQTKVPMVIGISLLACFYFLFSLRFSCFSHFIAAFKLLLKGGGHGSQSASTQSIPSFRALFTAIAGAAGLGNLAGIAIGISIGGPGVVFWILVASIVCMPLRFAEVYLGHKYRFYEKGEYQGGPYWYMKNGLAKLGFARLGAFLGIMYSVFLVISAYGGPSAFQVNQAVKAISHSFNLGNTWVYGLSALIAGFVFFITIGGIKRVSYYCSSAVMFFMSCYIILSIVVLFYYRQNLGAAFQMITYYAFNASAAYGGVVAVFIMAFQRLQLANETGFGTASSIHCNSSQNNSVKEALIAMICPVIDAVFVCFVTGIIVCVSGAFQKQGAEGIVMLQEALTNIHPYLGYFLAISIPIVAVNVMIAWSYYGVKNLEFLLKTKKFTKIYLASFCIIGFIGGVIDNLKVVIDLCNVVNFAVLVPNIIAIFILRKEISKGWNEYIINSKYAKNDKN